MSNIHPTAIIHESATIADDAKIGPYCVIHEGVEIGSGTWLQNHVTVAGPTKIGSNNRFFAYGSIGQQTQDLKYKGEPTYCEIGDNNTFREFITIHRSTNDEEVTRIGSNNNFLAYSHIAHECLVGDHVIFSNNGTLAGHVEVEDYAILGGLSAVHQFCRVGTHAITGGCTKIVQDVPPFMIADGNPAEVRSVNIVGLQRRGFSEASVSALKKAHRLLYRKNLNVTQALEEIRAMKDSSENVLQTLADFVESSERGIIR
ncbi:MAG: acyl-ACP--UDP-N-acetylglucosamine O-acyltransferase [Verrucomicrobiota bacterium]